ncbi:MAG TPA: DUF2939 domain-containing protein [Acetobacteraceae bacterium]|nr:DUF2939 domain-containing protein [Acetobacteraceae bacterium]
MKLRALLILVVAGYVASPYVALLKLQRDIRHHDVRALEADVDWDSVRASMKQTVLDGLAGEPVATKISATSDDDLPPFGASFGNALAQKAVDDAITPKRLADAFASLSPAAGEAAQPSVEAARFDGITSFEVTVRPVQLSPSDPPVRLEFRLGCRGWNIGWQVTSVSMPMALLNATETHAS